MKRIVILFFLVVSVTTYGQQFGDISPKVKFYTSSNKQASIIYPSGWESFSEYLLEVFAKMDTSSKISLGNKTKKWNVVLQHQTVIPNAYVRMAPLRSEFFLTPDFDNTQSGTLPWLQLLGTHEYRHIQQFSNLNNGITKVFSFLLGQQGQLVANGITIPDYFFEGDAVFQETFTSNQGRGRLPSFFSEMKALKEGNVKRNWQQLRNGSFKYVSPNHYNLGYQLVAYGYEKYGSDFWKKVTKDASSFKGLFYPFPNAIKRYSKVSYKKFRDSAIQLFNNEVTIENKQNVYSKLVLKKPRTVTNYLHLQSTNTDGLLYVKTAFDQVPYFYFYKNGKETKSVPKAFSLDNYFHYANDKAVYTNYTTDKRYGYVNYHNITLVDFKTGKQKQITKEGKYFQPSLNKEATKIVAVMHDENADNSIVILNLDGTIENTMHNNQNNVFTYPLFYNDNCILAINRNEDGANQLVKMYFNSNKPTEYLTPATYKAIGYPRLVNDSLYFNIAHNNSDQIAVLLLKTNEMYLLTDNSNSTFYPTALQNELYYSKVTAKGQLLCKQSNTNLLWKNMYAKDWNLPATNYLSKSLQNESKVEMSLRPITDSSKIKPYHRGKHLFNFHSWQPISSPTEAGIDVLSTSILNHVSTTLNYTYNTEEKSNQFGVTASYGGFFPIINVGSAFTFNRNTTVGTTLYNYNTAKAFVGFTIPLSKYVGRFYRTATVGASFNTEQILYSSIGKNIFNNRSFQHGNYFISASNQVQIAEQHLFPRWAQSFSLQVRDAMTFIRNKKINANSRFYFPGLRKNHHLVISAAYQSRDTTTDLFSKNFAFARGYEALNTRRMVKLGATYHFPLFYPDFGIGNIAYLKRVHAAAFYDINNSRLRLGGVLQNVLHRSVGGEIYFDGSIWNSLPINIGFRYSRLLDKDLQFPTRKSMFEVVLPIDIIPR